MRISPIHSCRNAPLITAWLLALTSQRSAAHLPRTLRLCLPMRSYRNVNRPALRQQHRSRRIRLGTVQRLSNAPEIMRACLHLAEKPPLNARPVVTPRQPSLAIPLLHHIYTFLFAGELGGRGERRGLAVGGDGCAAGRRGDAGRVDSGRFGGRNGAISHESENVSVGCDFSAFCVSLAL